MPIIQQFKVSDGERGAIQTASKLAGLTMSAWIRSRLIAAARIEVQNLEKFMSDDQRIKQAGQKLREAENA